MTESYDPRDGIDWGSRVPGDNVIDVYFAPAGEAVVSESSLFGLVTSEGFNTYEIEQFFKVFAAIETSVDITFRQVATRSDAEFVLGLDVDRDMAQYLLGWMLPPGETDAGTGMFNGRAWDRAPGGDLSVGGYGFVTILHEILHGLGLAHPFDAGGASSVFPGVEDGSYDLGPALLNQGVFTAMSYNSGFMSGPTGTSAWAKRIWDFGYEAGPSALDIAVLQQKYGANWSTAAGDDVYFLPGGNRIGTAYRTIWDTSGNDTLQYDGARDATIDLRAATLLYERGGGGYVSAAKGVVGGYTIAAGVEIENARSDAGDDMLIGNALGNLLSAGRGRDSIYGLAGDDVIFSGAGPDRVEAGDGDDTAHGQAGSDRLYGGAGIDRLFGGSGRDWIYAGSDDDSIDGGPGRDRIIGGDGVDVLRGGGGKDRLWGGPGSDLISGGRGDDLMGGGQGVDTFVFFGDIGHDRIVGFDLGLDVLRFDPSVWGGRDLSAAQIANRAIVTDDGVVWTFGSENSLTLVGLTDTRDLEWSILI